jgi:hypothetical protein
MASFTATLSRALLALRGSLVGDLRNDAPAIGEHSEYWRFLVPRPRVCYPSLGLIPLRGLPPM